MEDELHRGELGGLPRDSLHLVFPPDFPRGRRRGKDPRREKPPRMPLACNFRDPGVIADPFPLFAYLRENDPLHWSDVLGGWVLTRHADVSAALSDSRLSADRITPFLEASPEARARNREIGGLLTHWAVFSDPPRHTRLRGLMNQGFSSRANQNIRPRVEARVDALLDRFEGRDEIDLLSEFAYPLPASVISDILGVPLEDIERFKVWSDELAAFVGSALATTDKYDRARHGALQLQAYFADLIEQRRREPRPDLISDLLRARFREHSFSTEELIATCVMLLFAGHETTTNLIGNGVLALLRHPDQWRALVASPSLAPLAVEELLRFDGPVQALVRVARENIAFGNTAIGPGQRVFAMVNAANRDPAVFAAPDRLDIMRRESRHIAFGYGIHYCIGAPLARLEATIALRALARRFPSLSLSGQNIQWSDSLVLRGVRSLRVRI
jgi:cytochrome P450